MKNALVISILFLCSCQPILRSITGIKHIDEYTDTYLISLAFQYEIDTNKLYALNPESYLNFINTIDTTKYKSARHDMLQPLQVFYFDSSGVIRFHLINCNVGGFPNLKWNRFGYFDKKELTMPEAYLPYNQLTFDTLRPLLQPVTSNTQSNNNSAGYIVVFWDAFMGRQSEVLIETVKSYLASYPSVANLYFVNNDNLFSYIEQHQN